MHPQQFDTLARLTTTTLSCRRAVLALAAAALGSAAFGATPAAAGCKKVGRKCDKNKDCCDGVRCKGDKKDKKGRCRCKSGLRECGGRCQNLDTDENHCGSCNASCAVGIPCSAGTCCIPVRGAFEEPAGSCASSDECCDGGTCCTFNDVGGPESICIDLLTHQTACGSTCENVVNCLNFQPDRQCVNGECVAI